VEYVAESSLAVDVGAVGAAHVLYVGGFVEGDDFGVVVAGGGDGYDQFITFCAADGHDAMGQ